MPISNIWDLYDIDDAVLSASAAAIRNVGINAVYQERDLDNLATPYVTLQVECGNPIHQYWLENTGSVYDAWDYTMEVNVVTDRTANDVSHSIYRNKVYDTLGDYTTFQDLNYWFVENIVLSNVNKGVSENEDKDISTTNLKFSVWIKPSAWPS